MNDLSIHIAIVGLVFLLAIVFEMILLPRIIYIAKKKRLFDLPNKRKIHCDPIPRLGGMSFFPIIIPLTLLSLYLELRFELISPSAIHALLPEITFLISGITLISLVGIKDDLVGVVYRHKFLIQFIASIFIISSGVYINNLHGFLGIYEISPYVGIPLSLLLIVYTTNSINLIDGADGLASGLTALAFVVYGLLFATLSHWLYSAIAFGICGILIPFFYYNFFSRSRKIFMGDTGSLTLGFLLSFMMLKLMQSPLSHEILPNSSGVFLLVISALYIPLYDALRVMMVRILSNRPPFSPDRNHIHHKLIDLGYSRRKAVGIILVASVCLFTLNYLLLKFSNSTLTFIIDIILALSIAFLFIYLTNKKIVLNSKMASS